MILAVVFFATEAFSQCADSANIYSFVYNGHTYDVVKENKSWVAAAACAVERNGYLAEINDSNEQNALYSELSTNAGININNTKAPDGGNAAYVWIGGNDFAVEGNWVWDGVNDSVGPQFWQGDFNGNPVGGLYNNWGNEPDDFGFDGQDCLGLALSNWPYGVASQWNDVNQNNSLYYVIEYNWVIGLREEQKVHNYVSLYPNPASDFITISVIKEGSSVKNAEIINSIGQMQPTEIVQSIGQMQLNLHQLKQGVYFVRIELNTGDILVRKFIKKD